jgi:hypothetical protein
VYRRLALLVVASCSTDRDPPRPSRAVAPRDNPPILTAQQERAVVGEITAKARASSETTAGPCKRSNVLDRTEVVGKLLVSGSSRGRNLNAVGDLDEGLKIAVYADATVQPGRMTLEPRRGRDDFTRPVVVELYESSRGFDAVAGTLVIEATTPDLIGHLEEAQFRERREDFTYVPQGCTARITRIDFQFRP